MLIECASRCANRPESDLRREIIRVQSKVSVDIAIAQPLQLSGFRRMDNDTLENLMMVMVAQTSEAFAVKENLSPEGVYECALLIIEKFWYLRPEEVLYCFKQAKTGKYGPVYGRIDIPTVMEWLTKYDNEERLSAVERARVARVSQESEDMDTQCQALRELIAQPEGTYLEIKPVETEEQKNEKARKIQLQRYAHKKEPLF